MYTIYSKIEADQLRHKVNLLQHEQTTVANALASATEVVASMEAEAGDDKEALKIIKQSDDYVEWHAAEVTLEARSDSIETEIKLLNEEMKNFEKGSQQGIKEATSFWCFGG